MWKYYHATISIWSPINSGVKISVSLKGRWGGGGVSGAYRALLRFQLPACYHPNLGIFCGVCLFQNIFSSKIKPYPGWITFLKKIQWKIHFLTLLIIDRNSLKKIKIEVWTFSFQICFWNKFSTSGSGQTENTQTRVFVYFLFDHFPHSKIDSKTRFEMRTSIFLF